MPKDLITISSQSIQSSVKSSNMTDQEFVSAVSGIRLASLTNESKLTNTGFENDKNKKYLINLTEGFYPS